MVHIEITGMRVNIISVVKDIFITFLWNYMVSFVFLSVTATDAVVRNVYYRYFHPKEALVSNGVLNRFVAAAYICHTNICMFQQIQEWTYSDVVEIIALL